MPVCTAFCSLSPVIFSLRVGFYLDHSTESALPGCDACTGSPLSELALGIFPVEFTPANHSTAETPFSPWMLHGCHAFPSAHLSTPICLLSWDLFNAGGFSLSHQLLVCDFHVPEWHPNRSFYAALCPEFLISISSNL